MDMGVGNAGLVKFCRCLDTSAMHHNTYRTHSKKITDVLCESAQIVRKVYKDLDPSIDESGVIDLTVSFDGTWMTRGHKSLYGIGCVVEVVTGLVIDFAQNKDLAMTGITQSTCFMTFVNLIQLCETHEWQV